MIYNVIKRLILSGDYNKADISAKLNIYLLYNQITNDKYEELMTLMN